MAKSHSYRSRHTEGPGFGDWTDEVTLLDHFLFGNALTLRQSLAAQTASYSDKFIITGTVEVPGEISVLWYTPLSNKSLRWQINRLLKLSITPPSPNNPKRWKYEKRARAEETSIGNRLCGLQVWLILTWKRNTGTNSFPLQPACKSGNLSNLLWKHLNSWRL